MNNAPVSDTLPAMPLLVIREAYELPLLFDGCLA